MLEIGKTYIVTVKRITPKGTVVTLEDNTTEFIHVSRISSEYVTDVSEYVSVGDILQAECIKGTVHPAELSLLNLHLSRQTKGVKPTRLHNASVYNKSKTSKPATLDDMIARSNKVLSDKLGSNNLSKPKISRNRRHRSKDI